MLIAYIVCISAEIVCCSSINVIPSTKILVLLGLGLELLVIGRCAMYGTFLNIHNHAGCIFNELLKVIEQRGYMDMEPS